MASNFRIQLENYLKKIDVKCDCVLDVGGGQYPIKNRVKSWDVKNYKVLDNDPQYEHDYFCDLNDQGYSQERSWEDSSDWPKRDGFDVVFCLEVFEYIFRPFNAHQNIFDFLKPGGIAYLSYPTLYPLHPPAGIDYLRYSKNAIIKYLSEVGFKSWEITPRVATDGLGSLSNFYSMERMRPMKGTRDVYDIGYMVRAVK